MLSGACEVFSSGFFALVLGLFLLGNDDVRRYHVRTIVDLPEEQIRKLTLLCRRERISRAEAIRRAVARYLGVSSASDLGSFFGASRSRGNISRQVAALRGEWSRRS